MIGGDLGVDIAQGALKLLWRKDKMEGGQEVEERCMDEHRKQRLRTERSLSGWKVADTRVVPVVSPEWPRSLPHSQTL